MNSPKVKWEGVKIPRELIERASRLLRKHGYASINELVRDAVREKLEFLEKHGKKQVLIDTDSDAEVWEEVDE